MTTRDRLKVRTVVELRGSRQPVYSTDLFADLYERIKLARDCASQELPAPLIETSIRVRESEDEPAQLRPCSFDPSLVALIYEVDGD